MITHALYAPLEAEKPEKAEELQAFAARGADPRGAGTRHRAP